MSVLSPRIENLNISSENKENQLKSSPTKIALTRDVKISNVSDSKPEVVGCFVLIIWFFLFIKQCLFSSFL